jgi:hypothetical protein
MSAPHLTFGIIFSWPHHGSNVLEDQEWGIFMQRLLGVTPLEVEIIQRRPEAFGQSMAFPNKNILQFIICFVVAQWLAFSGWLYLGTLPRRLDENVERLYVIVFWAGLISAFLSTFLSFVGLLWFQKKPHPYRFRIALDILFVNGLIIGIGWLFCTSEVRTTRHDSEACRENRLRLYRVCLSIQETNAVISKAEVVAMASDCFFGALPKCPAGDSFEIRFPKIAVYCKRHGVIGSIEANEEMNGTRQP